MPFIFRAMLRNEEHPAVGNSAKMLGVRIPPDKKPDIQVDSSGAVAPEKGGMSVSPTWKDLPSYRIPERLQPKMPDASGSNEMACWRLGDLPFANGPVADRLTLRIDGPTHGLVVPAVSMPLNDYQSALAATRDRWVIDET